MTNPGEVVVTDAEVQAFIEAHKREIKARDHGMLHPSRPIDLDAPARNATACVRAALAAFLAARVPDADMTDSKAICQTHDKSFAQGYNACRDKVLKGV